MQNKKHIIIEMCAGYVGRTDTYTITIGSKSVTITHEVGGGMNKGIKPVTKELSYTEFKPIENKFDKIDFSKVYKESGESFGFDGWTFKCTIGMKMSGISVSLWCPSKSSETPETTKLLRACEMIWSLFGEEL